MRQSMTILEFLFHFTNINQSNFCIQNENFNDPK